MKKEKSRQKSRERKEKVDRHWSYSPVGTLLCVRIYALWNVYYSLATFNCWSFSSVEWNGWCMKIKRLFVVQNPVAAAATDATQWKWNAQIVRHGNFNDDTQRHSKNPRNYFWLMHSIILFDSLILFSLFFLSLSLFLFVLLTLLFHFIMFSLSVPCVFVFRKRAPQRECFRMKATKTTTTIGKKTRLE